MSSVSRQLKGPQTQEVDIVMQFEDVVNCFLPQFHILAFAGAFSCCAPALCK